MPNRNLINYLRDNQAKYETIKHEPAYTAQEIAAKAHIPGKSLAKAVMLKIDGKLSLMIESANYRVNLEELRKALKAKHIELAHEYEFSNKFSDCEVGAMAPMGEAYDLDIDVIIDQLWDEQDPIAFNAGNHSELIKMQYKDFAKLVKPKTVSLH